ncbi:helix-turn-helix domain-containing protein [Streptomyces sp. NPDC059447]|uniref:helix-turn-helix domain-containing protein n=1 Tax=Streptomyces sp. NPDC059447 TaxID=3346834 RepID=UPI0036C493ED
MATTRSPNSKVPTQPKDLNAPFFTAAEVAWLLNISMKTVYRRVAQGYPCSRRGTGPILVSQADLQRWYELDRVQPIRPPKRTHRKPLVASAA